MTYISKDVGILVAALLVSNAKRLIVLKCCKNQLTSYVGNSLRIFGELQMLHEKPIVVLR